MSIEVCPRCTSRFAVGLLRCPQCSEVAPLFADRMTTEEEQMPRITVAAGPSNAAAQLGEPGYVEPETVEAPAAPDPEPAAPAKKAAAAPAAEEPADTPASGKAARK